MQLSAPNFPSDPHSALPAGLPGPAGFGCRENAATAATAPREFGALLNAESSSAPNPPAEAATDGPGGDRPAATSGQADRQQDTLASWLAANGLLPAGTPPPPANPEVTLLEGTAGPAAEDPKGGLPAAAAGAGEGAAPNAGFARAFARPNGSVRGAQVRAVYSGGPTQSPAETGLTPADATDASPAAPTGRSRRPEGTGNSNPMLDTPLPAGVGTGVAESSAAQMMTPPASAAATECPLPGSGRTPAKSSAAPATLPATADGSPTGSLQIPRSEPSAVRPQPEAADSFPPVPSGAGQIPSDLGAAPSASVPAAKAAAFPGDLSAAGVVTPTLASMPDSGREKIAAVRDQFTKAVAALEKSGLKKSLSDGIDDVESASAALGINVAKPRDAMPTLAPNPARPSIDDRSLTFTLPSLDLAALGKDPSPPPAAELAGSAHRAVESVLAVTDHFTTTGGQHGVNLKFSVSGVELTVRVEVRGGNVQTTFRTDSPELRAALAVEWHAVAATSDERSQRLAEPVFTSSSGRDALQSDAGAADQRGARQGQPAPEPGFMPRTALRASTASTLPAPAAVPVPSVSIPGRLHTFA